MIDMFGDPLDETLEQCGQILWRKKGSARDFVLRSISMA